MKQAPIPADSLSGKIARLVQERGWNQHEFARLAGVSRLTVRSIFQTNSRHLHNATLAKCARALGMSVYDLCELPLEQLLRRSPAAPSVPRPTQQRTYEEATQPELLAWMKNNSDRAAQLTAQELDELLSLQGTGGPLTTQGVEYFVDLIERKRRLVEKMSAIAGTEYIDLLEQFIDLLYEKVQPYRNRR